jgi:RHS repeat-associated protein
VGKRVNGTLIKGFLYGDWLGPVAELDGAGAVVSRFVYAGRLAPAYLVRDGIAYRVITDQIGSVRLVVNAATGAVVQRLDYDAFGNVLVDTNPGFQPFGFAGGLYDPDTRLVHFGARDYDAETGRWTARDPIWFAGLDPNLYRYGHSDPINCVDPSGFGFSDILNDSVDDPLDFYGGIFEGALDLVIVGGVSSATGGAGLLPALIYLSNHSVLDTVQAATESDLIDTKGNVFNFGKSVGSLLAGGVCPSGGAGAAGEEAAAMTGVTKAGNQMKRAFTVITASQAQEGIAAAEKSTQEAMAATRAANEAQGRAAAGEFLGELQSSGQATPQSVNPGSTGYSEFGGGELGN